MWQAAAERLALLELLARGTLKRRQAQSAEWDTLVELPWTRRTGRREELGLVESRRSELVALLERVWPEWRGALADLTAGGFPPTPEGWAAMRDAQRAASLPTLPDRLNRRTAAALVSPHSKAALTDRRLGALGEVEATHDGTVRLRPPAGLRVRTPRGGLDLAAMAEVLGEVALPERAFRAGLSLEGDLSAALFIENLGTFCDLPALPGWLYAHVPGWDTATAVHLLKLLPHIPVIHFGDLDPNGVRIFQHLRTVHPGLRWFVPAHWDELAETRGLEGAWPADLDLRDAPPPLVRKLATLGKWLEQEPLAVDPRTPAALLATP